jgi:hypothetical protein
MLPKTTRRGRSRGAPAASLPALAILLVAALAATLPGPAAAQFVFATGGGAASSAGFSAEATAGGGIAGEASAAGAAASAGFRASLPTGAPFGILPPATATTNADATVVARLEDDVQVVAATLRYRRGGDGPFESLPMTLTDAATGEWSAVIPAGDLGVRGVQYFVEASDGVNVASVPAGAPVAALGSLPVTVADHPAFSLPAGTFVLAGAPLAPTNADPLAVFDELGEYDRRVWRYGTFDPASGEYREPGAAAPATPGRGFWVISRDGASIAVDGTSTGLAGNLAVPLAPGFNQIANPFAFPVDFADVVVPTGVDPNPIGWNGTAYVAGVTTLEPGTGYWIFNGSGAAATLEIPPLGAGVSRRSRAGSGGPAVPPGALREDEAGWGYRVRAEAAAFSDDDNRFGAREGAGPDKDAFDLADAPVPPGGYASVSFAREEGDPLLTDWRSPEEEGPVWSLVFRTDRAGEPYRIRLIEERPLPEGWLLVAVDEDGAETADLTGGGVLLGEAGSTALVRRWTLTAGPPAVVNETVEDLVEEIRETAAREITAFAFAGPFPNPSRPAAGTTFELLVPRDTRATVEIWNVAGRRIRTLLDGPAPRGAHALRWDGRDEAGRRVASGVYFVRAIADEFRHRGKVVVLE